MSNCPNNQTIQNVCNSPGVVCQFRPVRINTDNCGNTTYYREVIDVTTTQNIQAPNTDLDNIGLSSQCVQVRRTYQ